MQKFLIGCLALILSFSASAADKPNILVIFTDDQGWNDVSCYGSKIPTPNIDRLAAGGMRFTRFYAASAICTPSRFGLLTGRNPSRSHDQLLGALMFMSDDHRDKGIQADETTIAEVLRRDAGYHTALIGKWHLGHGDARLLPLANGFDHFIGHTGGCIDYFTMTYGNIPDWYHDSQHVSENGYATDLISAEAITFLKKQAGKNPLHRSFSTSLTTPRILAKAGARRQKKPSTSCSLTQPPSNAPAKSALTTKSAVSLPP